MHAPPMSRRQHAVLLLLSISGLVRGTPFAQDQQATTHNGCGIAHAAGYHNDTATHSIISNGINRTYGVYVPQSYNSNKPTTLVFDYHGRKRTPYDQYLNSAYFNSTTGGQDYLVVYPEGLLKAWEGANYAYPGVDDVQFTADLLTHIQQTYCVDTNRTYASGKSNGGGFVDAYLACGSIGDNFAAYAIAAPALYQDNHYNASTCQYKRAILESHGSEDHIVNATGGTTSGGTEPNITQWVSWWGMRNCGNSAVFQNVSYKGYYTTTYSCPGYEGAVRHNQVYKLDHCWPSSTGYNFDATRYHFCGDRVLDFTSEVVSFFSNWTLNTLGK